jgi:hypothetical protein
MLTVLVNDATTHGAVTTIEGRSFEDELVTLSRSGNVFLEKLLEGLSAYDAVAAFRVAQACGLTSLEQAPAFVRRGFEQPAFALFALEQMRHGGERQRGWMNFALEAGLAFSVTNQMLRQSQPPLRFQNDGMRSKRDSWTSYIGHNMLGWLLDGAYYDIKSNDTVFLEAIRKFLRPARFCPAMRILRTVAMANDWYLPLAIYSMMILIVPLALVMIKSISHIAIMYQPNALSNMNFIAKMAHSSWAGVIAATLMLTVLGCVMLWISLLGMGARSYCEFIDHVFAGAGTYTESSRPSMLARSMRRPIKGAFALIKIYRDIEKAALALSAEIIKWRLFNLEVATPPN